MSAVLVAFMVVLFLLFALGAVIVMTKLMKVEAEKVRASRAATTKDR